MEWENSYYNKDNPDEEARKRYMACIHNPLDVTVDMLKKLN